MGRQGEVPASHWRLYGHGQGGLSSILALQRCREITSGRGNGGDVQPQPGWSHHPGPGAAQAGGDGVGRWLGAPMKLPAAAGSRKLGGEKVSACGAEQQTRLVQTRLAAFCRKAGLSPRAAAWLGEMGMRRDTTHRCDELPVAARVPPLSMELNASWGSADVTASPVSLQVPKVSLAAGTP